MALEPFTIGSLVIPTWIILAISFWDLAWRAFAVWKSTTQKQPIWSVAFVLFQTLGILPIIYFLFFSKTNPQKKEVSAKVSNSKKKK